MNSTHRVEVVPVTLEPHPNADSLSIVKVYGYSVCVRTADWQDEHVGAYIPPDSIVDTTRPEFAFLAKPGSDKHRLKAIKLRGVVSFGMLVHAPVGSMLGDDVAEALGVVHYEPAMVCGNSSGGEAEAPPAVYAPHYDLDTARRYADCFVVGEPVHVTEKLHGTSARYVWNDGRMFAGSRKEWKRYDRSTVYWAVLDKYPQIVEFCKSHPGVVVYGEIYGWVQDLRYGHQPGCVSFAAFDLMAPDETYGGRWIDHVAARLLAPELPWVPLVASDVPFDFDALCGLADGKSLIAGADHVREGVVIVPATERYDERVGRVKLKLVGAGYLSK